MRSSRKDRNSCASCWSHPENWSAYLEVTRLKPWGRNDVCMPDHISCSSSAYACTSFPPVPRALLMLMSFWYLPEEVPIAVPWMQYKGRDLRGGPSSG